jgi:hypothetical protein
MDSLTGAIMIRDMTQRRKSTDRRSRSGRAREKGQAVPFTVELTPQHASALDACVAAERRTKKAIVLLALEQYFAAAGLWPPAAETGE